MKETKMNNKGFSLVELIIVIAIMAILVVVLAPQYLKYVEKSRVSSDAQTAVEFESALSVLASDPDITLTSGDDYSVKSNNKGEITISTPLKTIFEQEGIIDTGKTYKYTSTAFKNGEDGSGQTSIVLDFDGTVWKVTKNNIPDTNKSSGNDSDGGNGN